MHLDKLIARKKERQKDRTKDRNRERKTVAGMAWYDILILGGIYAYMHSQSFRLRLRDFEQFTAFARAWKLQPSICRTVDSR